LSAEIALQMILIHPVFLCALCGEFRVVYQFENSN